MIPHVWSDLEPILMKSHCVSNMMFDLIFLNFSINYKWSMHNVLFDILTFKVINYDKCYLKKKNTNTQSSNIMLNPLTILSYLWDLVVRGEGFGHSITKNNTYLKWHESVFFKNEGFVKNYQSNTFRCKHILLDQTLQKGTKGRVRKR